MTSSTIQHGPRAAHSIAETCALTGLGRDTVYTAIRDGHLVARKLGRRTLITDDDLRQFLAGLPRAGGFDQVMSECPVATINPPALRNPGTKARRRHDNRP
jgi:excisionase family DNA binding protein